MKDQCENCVDVRYRSSSDSFIFACDGVVIASAALALLELVKLELL